MNCPRCGSSKTSRAVRKEGEGRRAVETDIMDEWCDSCGWHGTKKIRKAGHDSRSKPQVPEMFGFGQEV